MGEAWNPKSLFGVYDVGPREFRENMVLGAADGAKRWSRRTEQTGFRDEQAFLGQLQQAWNH